MFIRTPPDWIWTKVDSLKKLLIRGQLLTKTFLKGGVSKFVYRNLKYSNIHIDEYNRDKDIEACAIQWNSTFDKLCILIIYRTPRDDFTNFINQLDLILQKPYSIELNWIEFLLHPYCYICNTGLVQIAYYNNLRYTV